ncbi:MAG: DNA polymerase III subunit delta' [Deltaproteobacteria bacterium]|nr:DNA polymerase III subunit delta' [Deltaproteobacteria bacterium]MBW1816286.1 DNA polymerase III subunit delta' [Deltaproteobacteria bacterium]
MAGFSHILGQEKPKQFLKKVLAGKKIPHAYLFTGMPGVGKTTMAMAMAMALNCGEPRDHEGCGQCPACRQIAGGRFPDFLVIEPEGKNIKIDQVREFNRMLGFAPAVGKYRVCVFRQAETMTGEAANSFLKTLEEPPPANVIILNATEPLDLLPTTVSRCQRVSFQPLSTGDIAHWLTGEKGEDPEKAEVLGRISGGSLGRALLMQGGDFLEKREKWLLGVTKLPALSNIEAVDMALGLAAGEKTGGFSAGGTEPGILDLVSTWRSWYRDLMLCKAEGPENLLINMDFSRRLKSVVETYIIKNLVESVDALDRADRDLRILRNPKLVMADTALRLRRLVGTEERP